jgi:hypothetical protein
MKKIITLIAALFIISSISFGQNPKTTEKKETKTSTCVDHKTKKDTTTTKKHDCSKMEKKCSKKDKCCKQKQTKELK